MRCVCETLQHNTGGVLSVIMGAQGGWSKGDDLAFGGLVRGIYVRKKDK